MLAKHRLLGLPPRSGATASLGFHEQGRRPPPALLLPQGRGHRLAEGAQQSPAPSLKQIVLFQLPLLVSPSLPSTWPGSCIALLPASVARLCGSAPSSSPCSSPPSSPCPAPATTSTTGRVGRLQAWTGQPPPGAPS